MGYPAVRFGVPDMHFHAWFLGMRRAMEMMVTGDSITGVEAVAEGWANQCFPADQLDDETLEVAERIAALPPELVQLNKRVVHRQMDHMGMRSGIRAGTELCALGTHTQAMAEFVGEHPGEGPHRRAHRARRDVRRLPHQLRPPCCRLPVLADVAHRPAVRNVSQNGGGGRSFGRAGRGA